MSAASFRPFVRMNLSGTWYGGVAVHIVGKGSWEWSTSCNTRWGARLAGRRRAAKLRKAYERGELEL